VTSSRNYLLVFLVLTTLGGAVLAWNQHLEIIKLNAALQEKDLDAQLHQREFDTKFAALQAKAHKNAAANDNTTSQNPADDQRQRGGFGNMRAQMNDPQFAQFMALQQKARLDSTYGPLFKQLTQQLNLSPAQLAAFQNLLTEKQNAARDVFAAARDQGLDPATDRAEIGQLVAQSNAEIDQQIQSTLGPDGFAQFQSYEQTLPERNTVNQIQQSLSYTSTPLTDAQYQQLLPWVIANAPPKASNPTSPRVLLGGGNPISLLPPTAFQNPPPFLYPSQIPALKPYIKSSGAQPAGAAPTTGSPPAGR
jgi:hypothetical protein